MNNFCNLEGRTVLVTGASSGIGEACAKLISKRGGVPFLLGRNEDRLLGVRRAIESEAGHVAGVFVGDLATSEGRNKMLDAIAEIEVSGVVFSAGISKPTPIQFIGESYLQELFDINVLANFLILSALVKRRKLRSSASIVFLTSIAAVTGTKATFAYSSSKGALIGSMKALSDEMSKKLIRINSVCPAVVKTPIFTQDQEAYIKEQEVSYPLGLAQTEDVAASVVFLLSEDSKTVVGQNLVIDSGCTNIK